MYSVLFSTVLRVYMISDMSTILVCEVNAVVYAKVCSYVA